MSPTLEALLLEKEPFVAVGIDATHPIVAVGLLEGVRAYARSTIRAYIMCRRGKQLIAELTKSCDALSASKQLVVELFAIKTLVCVCVRVCVCACVRVHIETPARPTTMHP